MKVIYDYKIFSQPYGGISRYYTTLANQLLKNGEDVQIIPGLHQNNYLKYLSGNLVNGKKLKRFPANTARIINLINHLYCELEIKFQKPDIVHETYYSSLPHLKTNSVRVTSVYDMIHELYAEDFLINDKTRFLKKASISRVDHIISISQSTKNDLIEILGVDEKKISVVHLGVDTNAFNQKLTTSIKKPYLLYVGKREGYKNFEGFLIAFSKSKKLKSEFSIIAFGGGVFSTKEKKLIIENNLENCIIQIGGDDNKLIELYQNATAFVYPSKYEGFGLPPLEAMAAGCPVISSNTSSMPEVINNAGELFDPFDIENIKHSIEKVVFSEARTKELIKLGNENLKKFSWSKCSKSTTETYKKIL